MDANLKEIIWQQFGAAIDMLENALIKCPDNLWNTDAQFWYKAYHTLFYLDYYLSEEPENFLPPVPFTLSEFEQDEMPEKVYSKNELLSYLAFDRKKFHELLINLQEGASEKRFINDQRNYSFTEILLYNMRHVQHHTAQLNLLMRQHGTEPPRWVSRTNKSI